MNFSFITWVENKQFGITNVNCRNNIKADTTENNDAKFKNNSKNLIK